MGKTQGSTQSAHQHGLAQPGHSTAGGSSRPKIDPPNLAGPTTPHYIASGQTAQRGVGAGSSAAAWAKSSGKQVTSKGSATSARHNAKNQVK
jgi:hypothetical protein